MLSHSSQSISCTDEKVIYLLALFPSISHTDICTLIEVFMSEHDVTIEVIDDGELVVFVADFIHPKVDSYSFLSQCKRQQELFEQAQERRQEAQRHEYISQIWENKKRKCGKTKVCSLSKEEEQERLQEIVQKQNVENENSNGTVNKNSSENVNVIDNSNVMVETKECTEEVHQKQVTEINVNDSGPSILSFGTKHTNFSTTHHVQNFLSSVLVNEYTNTLFASANFAALSHLREYNNTIEFFSIDTSEWDQMYLPVKMQSTSLETPRNVKGKVWKQSHAKSNKRLCNCMTCILPEDVYLPLDEEEEEELKQQLALDEHVNNDFDTIKHEECQHEVLSQRVPIIKWAPTPIATILANDISSDRDRDSINVSGDNNITANDENVTITNIININNKGVSSDNQENAITNHGIMETNIVHNEIEREQQTVTTTTTTTKANCTVQKAENYLISVRDHDNANDDSNEQLRSATKITQTSSLERSSQRETTPAPITQQNTLPPSVQFAQLIGLGSSSSSSSLSNNDSDKLAQDECHHANQITAASTQTASSTAQQQSTSQHKRITEVQSRRSVSRLSAAFPLCEWVINANSPNVQIQKENRALNNYDEKSYQEWSVQRSRWREEQQEQRRVWHHQQLQQQKQSRHNVRRAQSEQVRRSHSLHRSEQQVNANSIAHNPSNDYGVQINLQNKLECIQRSEEEEEEELHEPEQKEKHNYCYPERSENTTSKYLFDNVRHYRAQSAEPTYLSKLWSEVDKSVETNVQENNCKVSVHSPHRNNECDICDVSDRNNDWHGNVNEARNVQLQSANTNVSDDKGVFMLHRINTLKPPSKAVNTLDHEVQEANVANNITSDTVCRNREEDSLIDGDSGDNEGESEASSFDVLEFLESEERRAHCMMNTLSAKGVEFDHRGKCHLAELIMNKCPAMVNVLHCQLPKLLELIAELLKGTKILSAKDEMAVRVPVIDSRKLLAHGPLILSNVEFDTSMSHVTLEKEVEWNAKRSKRQKNKSKVTQPSNINSTSVKSDNGKKEKSKCKNDEEEKSDSNICFALDITVKELKALPMSFAFIDEEDAYRQSRSSPEQTQQLLASLSSTSTAIDRSTAHKKTMKWFSRSKHKEKIIEEIPAPIRVKSQYNVSDNDDDDDDDNSFLYYDHRVTSGTLNIAAHKIHITACASLTLSLTRVMALNISKVHLCIGKINIDTSVRTLNILCTLLKPIIKRMLIRRLKTLLQ